MLRRKDPLSVSKNLYTVSLCCVTVLWNASGQRMQSVQTNLLNWALQKTLPRFVFYIDEPVLIDKVYNKHKLGQQNRGTQVKKTVMVL